MFQGSQNVSEILLWLSEFTNKLIRDSFMKCVVSEGPKIFVFSDQGIFTAMYGSALYSVPFYSRYVQEEENILTAFLPAFLLFAVVSHVEKETE
jgi:hypothetical protein